MGTLLTSECCLGAGRTDSRGDNNFSSSSDLDENSPLNKEDGGPKHKKHKNKKKKKKKNNKMYKKKKHEDRDESVILDSEDEAYSNEQQPHDENIVMAPLYQFDTKAMEMIADNVGSMLLPNEEAQPPAQNIGQSGMDIHAMDRRVQLRTYMSQDMFAGQEAHNNPDAVLPEIPTKPDAGSIAGGNVSVATLSDAPGHGSSSGNDIVISVENVHSIQSMDTAPPVQTAAATEVASIKRLSVLRTKSTSKSDAELRALIGATYAVSSAGLDDDDAVDDADAAAAAAAGTNENVNTNEQEEEEEAGVESDHSEVSEDEQKEIDRRKSMILTTALPLATRIRTPDKLFRDRTATPWEEDDMADAMGAMAQQLMHLQNSNSNVHAAQSPDMNSMPYGVDLSPGGTYSVALNDKAAPKRALLRGQSMAEWTEDETNTLNDEMTEQLVHLMKSTND